MQLFRIEIILRTLKTRPTIVFIIFLDFLVFYQIFLSSQVERCAIITDRHGLYEFPHELPNDLRMILQITIPQYAVPLPKLKFYLSQQKTLEKQNLNLSSSALPQAKPRVSLKGFVTDCLWKPVFYSNSSQTHSNLISLTILVTLRSFTLL